MRYPHVNVPRLSHKYSTTSPFASATSREGRALQRLRRVYPAPISAPTPTPIPTPIRASGLIWLISVSRRRYCPRCMWVLVIQETFMEPNPRSCTTGRTYTETRVLVHVVVVIMLTKCIVQLLRTRCDTGTGTAWHCV